MTRVIPILPALAAIASIFAATSARAHEWVDYFPYGEAGLSPRGYLTAREVAAYAKRADVSCLRLVSHMDTMETHEFSTELSRRRAQAMATELVIQGVDPAIIALDARGSGSLARPTADRIPEQLNRRVLVEVSSRACAR
jgi:outer membrane protein OmpA-like peptidoglycan-associated protein